MSQIFEAYDRDCGISIDLTGAHVTGLRLGGHDIFFDGEEGGKPRRSHVCWPNFSTREGSHLPQHGVARRLRWKIVQHGMNPITLVMQPVRNDQQDVETMGMVPQPFRLEMILRVKPKGFQWELTSENHGVRALAENPGFHPYFAIPADPSWIRSQFYTDPEPIGDGQALRLVNRDRILFQMPDGKRLRISSPVALLPDLVIWASSLRAPYTCIEPCRRPDKDPLLLAPREVRTVWMKIELL